MPRMTRPPESACAVDTILARCAGLRKLLKSSSTSLDQTLRPTGTGIGGSSEPAGLVDHISERLSREKASAIVEQDLVATVVEVGAEAGGMRRDEHAGHGPERMVGGQRLLLEDVEP